MGRPPRIRVRSWADPVERTPPPPGVAQVIDAAMFHPANSVMDFTTPVNAAAIDSTADPLAAPKVSLVKR